MRRAGPGAAGAVSCRPSHRLPVSQAWLHQILTPGRTAVSVAIEICELRCEAREASLVHVTSFGAAPCPAIKQYGTDVALRLLAIVKILCIACALVLQRCLPCAPFSSARKRPALSGHTTQLVLGSFPSLAYELRPIAQAHRWLQRLHHRR